MLLLFVSLLGIYLRLDIGRAKVSRQEFYFIHVPISVYIGWISVATIANVTALLVEINWQGFGIDPGVWTILLLAIVTLLTCLMLINRKDIAYSLVILWALLGILIKRINTDPLFGVREDIAYTATFAMVVVTIFVLFTLFRFFKIKSQANLQK